MALLETSDDPHAAAALLFRQVEALDAWNAARHQRERVLLDGVVSREVRLDVVRRLQLLNRAHGAVLERAAESLQRESLPWAIRGAPRAVIAHRHEWLAGSLSDALEERGVVVVAVTGDGAEALGLTVAEQPELLVVGQPLVGMTPAELLAEARLFAPSTVLAARVVHGGGVGEMLDAGAHHVVTQSIRPRDVAETFASLVRQRT